MPVVSERRKAEVLARDNNQCRHCGAASHLVPDHIVPQIRGGTSRLDNLQTLCVTCNSRKRDKDVFWVFSFNGLAVPTSACRAIPTRSWKTLHQLLCARPGYFYAYRQSMLDLMFAGVVNLGAADSRQVCTARPGPAFEVS